MYLPHPPWSVPTTHRRPRPTFVRKSLLVISISIGYAAPSNAHENEIDSWCRRCRTLTRNESVSCTWVGTRMNRRTHITLETSCLITGINDTGRTEFNQRGAAELDSRDGHGLCSTSIVQLPAFSFTTIFETYTIDLFILTKNR